MSESDIIPVIIDTDTAQDDCVTLLVGLLDPRADLRAITMVAGNVDFDRQFVNAQLTLNAAGKLGTTPIFLGARHPLVREWVSASDVHGDGTGGLEMDMSGLTPEREHAVDALLRLTAEDPGEISIVCIGPLTNIALAVRTDPTFAQRVKALYIMGGSNNARGNITPAAEFNFFVDPHAAKVVFGAGFRDVVVVPWAPLTIEEACFTRAEYDLGVLGDGLGEVRAAAECPRGRAHRLGGVLPADPWVHVPGNGSEPSIRESHVVAFASFCFDAVTTWTFDRGEPPRLGTLGEWLVSGHSVCNTIGNSQ